MASEASRPIVDDDSDWSDDDVIYNADVAELSQDIHTNEHELYESLPIYRDGVIRSTIEGLESGQHVHHKSKAGCSVSITRLVWVDGWRNDGRGEAMTLVVLKLGFKPESRDGKVTYASFKLRLKSDEIEDADPRLVAWGPFRHPEVWNGVQAHKRVSVTPSVSLNAGVAGQEISMGVSNTREVEWNEIYTDYGRSSEKYNKRKKESPNGVLWEVFQNSQLKRGITPEIRVAALFSRPRSGNYKVALRISADTGKVNEAAHRGLRLFNKKAGDKIYWSVTERPGNTDDCHAEGCEIIKDVDLNNLGKLVGETDSTELKPQWLNKWERVEMSQAIVETEATSSTPVQVVAKGQPLAVPPGRRSSLLQEAYQTSTEAEDSPQRRVQTHQVSLDATAALATSTPQSANANAVNDNVQPGASKDPEAVISTSQTPNSDYRSRLVALEDRAARAEARIAKQDQHIVELQRTLTRVAQAFLAIGC